MFKLVQFPAARIIELSLPQTLDASEFDLLNEQMLAAVQGSEMLLWILDLNQMDYIGSAVLGLIVNVRQRVKTGGGRLVLCHVSPRLHGIIRACSMDRLFTIFKTRDDALRNPSR